DGLSESAWSCEGPDPVDPSPRDVSIPSAAYTSSTFPIDGWLANCSSTTLTNIAFVMTIHRVGSADATLVVPPSSAFYTTDGDGVPLDPGAHVTTMVLHATGSTGFSCANATQGAFEVSGYTGSQSGSASVSIEYDTDQGSTGATSGSLSIQ